MGAHFFPADKLRRATWEAGFRVRLLAKQMGLEVRTLERRFETGLLTTPRNWIRQERIQGALPMLAAELSNKQIAAQLGYSRATNFGRDFKRVLGCTPRNYRRQQMPPASAGGAGDKAVVAF